MSLEFYCSSFCKGGFRLNAWCSVSSMNGEPWRLKWASVPFWIKELKEFSQQKAQASDSEIIQKKKRYRFLTLSNFWALSMESLCLIEWWNILWEKWGMGPGLSPLPSSFYYYYCLSSIHCLYLKATRQGPTNLPGPLCGSQAKLCSPLDAPSIITLDPHWDMI